ncbi:MAG: R2-like ligand-binding oxidase [Candidatus Promineifilaceae bacterium]|nr:R2-like ligand-binding oxidase [Candidatus Promineifilaceae bacterium]
MAPHTFATTTRGLRRDSLPMRLFEKAKQLGAWNPSDIDFSRDRQQWQAMTPDECDLILRLTAMFQAGEEAVTLDLLPLIMVIAAEGRLEEEMFLTTFLYEEAKHTDFFSRFVSEVVGGARDLTHYHDESYRIIFYEALPQALNALRRDPSPEAQVRAAVTYNMVVEGILAETGYHAYFSALEANALLPGTREGVRLLKQDESRHIAYGIFLLSRLVAAEPELWDVLEETMNALLVPALGVVGDAFAPYNPPPFGLREEDFVDYAMGQFQKRIERVERARETPLEAIMGGTPMPADS